MELERAGWRWMELGGAGARFSNTLLEHLFYRTPPNDCFFKSRNRLFTMSKQTFPSHFSEAAYYLRFYRRK